MTLHEFLKKTGVDVKDENSSLGNSLYGELALANQKIDFDKKIDEVNDEELYQIGRILILNGYNEPKSYFSYQFVEIMKDKIRKYNENNDNAA